MHFFSSDLEFDDFFVWGNDSCMERLITVLFRDGNIVFYTTVHWGIEGMNESEDEIAGNNVRDDDSEGG